MAAAGGILLLVALAVGVILLAPEGGPLRTWVDEALTGPAAAPRRPPGPLPSISLPTPAPEPPPAPVLYGPGPPEPPQGSWEAVPVAARASSLGPAGAAVGRELNEIQPRLAACFDEDVQARHGRSGFTESRDHAPMEDHGTTVLVLQLEVSPGRVRIEDAPVEARGTASDGLIACAQRVLRGMVVEAPGVQETARRRLLFPLLN